MYPRTTKSFHPSTRSRRRKQVSISSPGLLNGLALLNRLQRRRNITSRLLRLLWITTGICIRLSMFWRGWWGLLGSFRIGRLRLLIMLIVLGCSYYLLRDEVVMVYI